MTVQSLSGTTRARRARSRAPIAAVLALAACSARPAPCAVPAPAPAALAAPSTAPTWTLDQSTFDPTAAPCDDFYKYVCGGWARTPIPPDRAAVQWARDAAVDRARRTLDQLLTGGEPARDPELQRVRAFHAVCMADDETRDRAALPVIQRWMQRIAAAATAAELQAVSRDLQTIGVHAWLDYTAARDPADPVRYRGELSPGALGLRLRSLTDRSPRGTSQRAEYRAFVARMFEHAGISAARAGRDAAAVLDIETTLAGASPPRLDEYDPRQLEHPTAPDALHTLAPHIDWAKWLALVGHPPGKPLNLAWPPYIQALDQVLGKRSVEDLRAVLRWWLLDSLGDALPSRLANEYFRFHGVPGVERPDRAQQCKIGRAHV